MVTPEGSPLIATVTLPLKLFSGEIAIETAELALPCVTDTEPGWTVIAKSPGTGGGGVNFDSPPPQALMDSPATSARTNNEYRLGSVIEKLLLRYARLAGAKSKPRSLRERSFEIR